MSEERPVPARNGAAEATPRRRTVWVVALAVGAMAVAGALVLRSRATPEDAGAGAGGPRGERAPAPVRAAPVITRDVTVRARYTGELDADAAEIAARTAGLLEEVRVRIGDQVSEGDVLARVDATQARRQVAEARAQVQAAAASERRARAGLGAATAELERTEPLLADRLVSPQEVDALRSRVESVSAEADAARAQADQAQARIALLNEQIADARLTAPFDGAVAERYLDPGAVVSPGTKVLRLVQSGALRVRFRVPERDVGRVQPGLAFEVSTQATGDRRFSGQVTRVSAEVSREDRTVAVEGVLDETISDLRPGMYAEVSVSLGTLEDALAVPGSALVERLGDDGATRTGVFVVTDTSARFVPVSVRGRAGEVVAVEGLGAGMQVVTLGQAQLRDGAPVNVVAEEGGAE